MLDALLSPLALGFFRQALVGGLLVAVVCGTLGVFVVLRGMEYIGDAIAHSVLPGVVVAYLLQGSLFLGGLVSALITAAVINALSRDGRLRDSTAIGVVFTGALALGVLVLSATRSYARDLASLLFGNTLGISIQDMWLIAALTVVIVVAVWLFFKELVATAFDPTHARKLGLPVNAVRGGLMFALALTIVAGAQAVGVLMVTALLITPAATASTLTHRLPRMVALSIGTAVFSVVIGLYGSYYLNVVPGAAVVLVAALCFLAAYLGTHLRRGRASNAV